MGKTLTARIPDDLAAEIARISEEEHLDKSAVARRLLQAAVREHRISKALERYADGRVTLRGAARQARLTLRELLDEMAERDVALQYDVAEFEQDLRSVLEDRGGHGS